MNINEISSDQKIENTIVNQLSARITKDNQIFSNFLGSNEKRTDNKIKTKTDALYTKHNAKVKRAKNNQTKIEQANEETSIELDFIKNLTFSESSNNVNAFASNLKSSTRTESQQIISKTTQRMGSVSPSTMTSITTKTNAMLSTQSNTIDSMSNMSVKTISSNIDKYTNSFKTMVGMTSKTPSIPLNTPSVPSNILNISNVQKYNFLKRDKSEASTSRYIQANIPTKSGKNLIPNTNILSKTPDSKIITPNLKTDTNKVKQFASNPLAALLGFVSSLIPSFKTTEIAEPKPTSDKAEYGKVTVKENKAGFVEISDETPNNVRKIDLHPTGTYTALLDNGDYHTKVTNDRQEITDGNWNIKTSSDKIEIVEGDTKIEIRKGYTEQIDEDFNSNVEGDKNSVVAGDVYNDYQGDYNTKVAQSYNESVGANRKESTGGNYSETIMGNHEEKTTGNLSITVMGSINIKTLGATNVISKSMVRISAPKIKLN